MRSFVALDFETANQHRSSVCSVGLVIVENGRVVDKLYELIKPIPNFYTDWTTEIHGITFEDTVCSLEFPLIWRAMFKSIHDLPIVAHNSAFDESCLKAVLEAYGLPMYKNPFLCTYRRSKDVFPDLLNHKLTTVSEHLGFVLKNHHNALADAEACAYIATKIF